MKNYINLTFDYDLVQEKDWLPCIANEVCSFGWTSRIETLDDIYMYKKWWCISVISWSQQDNRSLILDEGKFSIQRRKENLEEKFYEDFSKVKNEEECEAVWQWYNDELFAFALQSIERIREYRQKIWLPPIVYDFVHTPTTRLTIGAAKRLAKHLWLPLISTIHVHEKEIQQLKWNQYPWSDFILAKDKETKTDSDWVIAKDMALCKDIQQLNPNCIYIGNDLDFESYDTTYLLQKDPKTILYVWRISYEKWFDRFAELVEKLNKKDRSYTFIICGKVRNDEKIAHHIQRLKTYDNVFFEWYLDRVSIQDAFLNAGTFILASRTETYNQTTMEALFYGCNVIATDVWGVKEQIENCTSGYVIPNDDNFVDAAIKKLENMQYNFMQYAQAHDYAQGKFNSNIYRTYKMNFLEKTFEPDLVYATNERLYPAILNLFSSHFWVFGICEKTVRLPLAGFRISLSA